MESVTVTKAELLAKLTTNREEHIAQYRDALAGWRAQAEQKLEVALDVTATGDVSLLKSYITVGDIPGCHAGDYDDAIAMLEMSVDTNITLNSDDFRRLVMDKWTWKQEFTRMSDTYSGKRG